LIINGIKGIKKVLCGITKEDKEMTIVDTVLTALVMLLGTEDEDYLILERDLDEWRIVGWLRRN